MLVKRSTFKVNLIYVTMRILHSSQPWCEKHCSLVITVNIEFVSKHFISIQFIWQYFTEHTFVYVSKSKRDTKSAGNSYEL